MRNEVKEIAGRNIIVGPGLFFLTRQAGESQRASVAVIWLEDGFGFVARIRISSKGHLSQMNIVEWTPSELARESSGFVRAKKLTVGTDIISRMMDTRLNETTNPQMPSKEWVLELVCSDGKIIKAPLFLVPFGTGGPGSSNSEGSIPNAGDAPTSQTSPKR